MIGTTVSHYKILEQIGSGGMSVVYLAEDTELERKVAIKFLPQHLTQDQESVERFKREAKAAATLNHPNIITIYEISEFDGQIFIVMEHVDGKSLREVINQYELGFDKTIDIISQISEGLLQAHKEGIVHRDLKPENIIVGRDGRVRILDFGLAKLKGVSKLTKETSTLGTIHYMSPEQIQGKEVDHRSDIWSLGVILYELLTGNVPFAGEYEQAVYYAILNEKIKPILEKEIPDGLVRIIEKCLAKNPSDRFKTADEIKTDLSIFKGETAVKTARQIPLNKSRYFKIAIPLLIAIIAIVIFILVSQKTGSRTQIPIMVIDCIDNTGEDKWEELSDLLTNTLQQSKRLSVMTRFRMRDISRQLGKEDVHFINENLGREIADFDSIRVFVKLKIRKIGLKYIIDIAVIDLKEEKYLLTANDYGESENDIYSMIDRLAVKTRESLEESAEEIQQTTRPVAEITTSNYEALSHYSNGKIEYGNSNFEDAHSSFEKALQLDSTFAMAQLYLGWSFHFLRNENKEIKAYKNARAYSNNALNNDQKIIETFNLWVVDGKREEALQILKQMVKEYPKEKNIHYFLGEIYRQKMQYNEAISHFEAVITLDPKYGLAYEDLTGICVRIGDHEKAIYHLKHYTKKVPGIANPYDLLGSLYFQLGKLDSAVVNFKKAVKIQPEFRSNWKLAYIYALKEEYTEAMKWIENYITKVQSQELKAEGLWWTALYNFWTGRIEDSFREIYYIKGLAEEFADDYNKRAMDWTMAWFYYDREDFENSYRIFKEWAVGPESEYFALGLLDLKAGRIVSAKSMLVGMRNQGYYDLQYSILYPELLLAQDSLERALSFRKTIKPYKPSIKKMDYLANYNVPFLKDVFARVYSKMGDRDRAIAEYERLTTFNPESVERFLIHPKYHYLLGKLYQKRGDVEKAIERYRKFLKIWKNADKDLPELIDAKKRLTILTETKIK